jgi:hypothetical protein
LADNITTQNSLGDGFMLDFRGMFETSIDNGSKQFWLEQKVLETRSVDTYVVTLFAIRFGSTTGCVLGDTGDFLLLCV